MATRKARHGRKPTWEVGSGFKVRLRYPNIPITGTVSTKKYGDVRWELYPNKWAELPEYVYESIKGKFETNYETEVPDWKYHEKNPHDPQDNPRMTTEVHSPFIMEFKEERKAPEPEKVKVSQSAYSKKDRKLMEEGRV